MLFIGLLRYVIKLSLIHYAYASWCHSEASELRGEPPLASSLLGADVEPSVWGQVRAEACLDTASLIAPVPNEPGTPNSQL